jgi:hypothetical protein
MTKDICGKTIPKDMVNAVEDGSNASDYGVVVIWLRYGESISEGGWPYIRRFRLFSLWKEMRIDKVVCRLRYVIEGI